MLGHRFNLTELLCFLLLLLIPTHGLGDGNNASEGLGGESVDVFAAAHDGNVDAVLAFLKQQETSNETMAVSLAKRDHNGWSLVHLAAKNGHTKVIEVLLDAGADVNAKLLSNSTSVSCINSCSSERPLTLP
jgi:ankyrin repeat protein